MREVIERRKIAIRIMAALYANPEAITISKNTNAVIAVAAADALIEELNKPRRV